MACRRSVPGRSHLRPEAAATRRDAIEQVRLIDGSFGAAVARAVPAPLMTRPARSLVCDSQSTESLPAQIDCRSTTQTATTLHLPSRQLGALDCCLAAAITSTEYPARAIRRAHIVHENGQHLVPLIQAAHTNTGKHCSWIGNHAASSRGSRRLASTIWRLMSPCSRSYTSHFMSRPLRYPFAECHASFAASVRSTSTVTPGNSCVWS